MSDKHGGHSEPCVLCQHIERDLATIMERARQGVKNAKPDEPDANTEGHVLGSMIEWWCEKVLPLSDDNAADVVQRFIMVLSNVCVKKGIGGVSIQWVRNLHEELRNMPTKPGPPS